jgi:DNA-binding protein YbaB
VSWEELNERVARLSITEKSGDGTVKVTVSASGLLTDLVLKDRWNPQPPEEVAAQIMECVRRAQARIPDLLRQAMFDTVGTQDPSTHLVLAEARRRFPEPPPREVPRSGPDEIAIGPDRPAEPAAPPRPRTSQPRDDEDWDERAVMEDI